jgi:tetrahydromethanopterin S-methyltransferase subunit A
MADVETPVASAFRTVIDQMQEAIAAPKCHKCGCLQQTVEALAGTEAGRRELLPVLTQARGVFVPKRYDCLGCPVCYPALAANAFAEAFPEAGGSLDLCPTEEPEERRGWPPLPGDYAVLRYGAPVAVCTLNSEELIDRLVGSRPEGLAIAGTMHTENLGIERIIQNTLANPHIRFLLLCGADTRQVVGHLPGQSFESLLRNGLDERGRIIGAQGKRPVLKNVSREEVQAFMQQVELVSMIGEESEDTITGQIRGCAERDPGPYPHPFNDAPVERVKAEEPKRLVLDRAGYFVIYPDARAKRLVVEHYSNQGVLDCVLEGASPGAIYTTAIERQLLTRLDHAAYLGRELARAERSLLENGPFIQDAAPGEVATDIPQAACGTDSSCNCSPAAPTKEGC